MMYQNKLAIAIKSNGKVLRENKDIVYLPYGSEFSIFVKNLDSRRVSFDLQIDGQDVLDGTSILVDANSETEVKRFIRNGNMNEGNAFKFIERTSAIENGPRGIDVSDGLVRIEYRFEKERVYPQYSSSAIYRKSIGSGISGSSLRSMKSSYEAGGSSVTGGMMLNSIQPASANAHTETFNDVGITVPGSKVDQTFTPVYGFVPEAQSHVIVMRLVGKIGEDEVPAPVTVDHKPKCVTCGRVNKVNSNYCATCGTALALI